MVEKNTSTEELLELLKKKRSFDEYLKETPEFITGDLSAYLEQMLVEKGRKKADVIRGSQLDRNYAYQIFSGTRKPTGISCWRSESGWGFLSKRCRRCLRHRNILSYM